MTTGIGNEWDPGDPPETDLGYTYTRRIIMASRLSLGRIINWAKESDEEELHFVIHRLTQIAQTRAARIAGADGLAKVKRARRTKKQIAEAQMSSASKPDTHDLSVSA
jgi:hypothetical protein